MGPAEQHGCEKRLPVAGLLIVGSVARLCYKGRSGHFAELLSRRGAVDSKFPETAAVEPESLGTTSRSVTETFPNLLRRPIIRGPIGDCVLPRGLAALALSELAARLANHDAVGRYCTLDLRDMLQLVQSERSSLLEIGHSGHTVGQPGGRPS
jgi:hypothetical protein